MKKPDNAPNSRPESCSQPQADPGPAVRKEVVKGADRSAIRNRRKNGQYTGSLLG